MHTVLKDLNDEYQDKIDIYGVNIDDEHHLLELFTIKEIPTTLFIPMEGTLKLVGGIGKEKFKKINKRYF